MKNRKFYLIGMPLGHSHSPAVHAKLGNRHYSLLPLAAEELDAFLEKRDFRGINVTIPYKEAVLPYCDAIDCRAAEIGAVNTIVNCGGALYGTNTDVDGFVFLCHRAKIDLRDKKVLILGTGGTSKTAFAAAKQCRAREIVKVSRSGEVNYENVHALHGDAQILINTTPVGMYPHTDAQPIDLDGFPALCGVLDVIYNPLKTRLILDAEARGIPAAGGLPMLVAQAAFADLYFRGGLYMDLEINRITADLRASLQNIVLTGMPGCGKSTVGKILSKVTGRPLYDLDRVITERTGKSIPEIFAESGENAFRDLETEVTREIAAMSGVIIACGGGTVLREVNRTALKQNGIAIYIQRELKDLAKKGRPLSAGNGALEKLYAERREIYEGFADITIAPCRSVGACANRILHALKEEKRK